MKNFLKILVSIAVVISATVSFAQWQGPTATAPGGNTSPPINESAAAQIKSGGVSLGSLIVVGAIQVGQTSASCDSTLAGTIRFENNNIELCSSDTWTVIGSGALPSSCTDGQTISYNASSTTWSCSDSTGGGSPDIVYVRFAQVGDSFALTQNSANTITLDEIVEDTGDNIVSLTSNQLELEPGTYRVRNASVSLHNNTTGAAEHNAQLVNVTDGTALSKAVGGISRYFNTHQYHIEPTIFTIGANKKIELQVFAEVGGTPTLLEWGSTPVTGSEAIGAVLQLERVDPSSGSGGGSGGSGGASLPTCADSQILSYTASTTSWGCADNTGGSGGGSGSSSGSTSTVSVTIDDVSTGWRLPSSWAWTAKRGLTNSGRYFASAAVTGHTAVVVDKTFEGDFEFIASWAHNYRAAGMVYGPNVSHADLEGYSIDGNGPYFGALNTSGFPNGYSASYMGQYHAPIQGGGAATTKYWFKWKRVGNILSLQYSTTENGTYTDIVSPVTINSNDKVVVGIGEAASSEAEILKIVSLTYDEDVFVGSGSGGASLPTCADSQILSYTASTTSWGCADNTGGSGSSSANSPGFGSFESRSTNTAYTSTSTDGFVIASAERPASGICLVEGLVDGSIVVQEQENDLGGKVSITFPAPKDLSYEVTTTGCTNESVNYITAEGLFGSSVNYQPLLSDVDVLFTNCNQEGRTGPSQAQCNATYSGSQLESNVTVTSGIQYWTVPETGTYTIDTKGAAGSEGTGSNNTTTYLRAGGKGANIKADFDLTAGQVLKILVGQKGSRETSYIHQPGGGGGGTFVAIGNTPLIVVGGGGGGGTGQYGQLVGLDASITEDATYLPLSGYLSNHGVDGSGGGASSNNGGGAGFLTDGSINGAVVSAKSFLNGGVGGNATSYATNSHGGFGGGGAGSLLPGGGGGYSGGGTYGAWSATGQASGGGSYNRLGYNTVATASSNTGHGSVHITKAENQGIHNNGDITGPVVFTNCGKEGNTGPEQSECTAAYGATELDENVTVSNGIQSWTVPETGTYTIEALGAAGSDGMGSSNISYLRAGGKGASIEGDFALTQGQVLDILVGQKGGREIISIYQPGGGGGGTFVAIGNTPLIVAGGGAGGGNGQYGQQAGLDGLATEGGGETNGGTGGTGGGYTSNNGGGAGFSGNGGILTTDGVASQSFLNGGEGGYANTYAIGSFGGFGGGGGGRLLPGGGGGYSGGGTFGTWSGSGRAGGGGSFNSGTSQTNTVGVNTTHGQVTITKQ